MDISHSKIWSNSQSCLQQGWLTLHLLPGWICAFHLIWHVWCRHQNLSNRDPRWISSNFNRLSYSILQRTIYQGAIDHAYSLFESFFAISRHFCRQNSLQNQKWGLRQTAIWDHVIADPAILASYIQWPVLSCAFVRSKLHYICCLRILNSTLPCWYVSFLAQECRSCKKSSA